MLNVLRKAKRLQYAIYNKSECVGHEGLGKEVGPASRFSASHGDLAHSGRGGLSVKTSASRSRDRPSHRKGGQTTSSELIGCFRLLTMLVDVSGAIRVNSSVSLIDTTCIFRGRGVRGFLI